MIKINGQLDLRPDDKPHQFASLADGSYRRLREKLTTRTCRKGENLLVPGQVQNELYLVREGTQMSFYGGGDKVHVMAFTYAPDICVVPDSFALQEPSKYTITCLTRSTLDCIAFDDLESLFNECHDLERLFRLMTTKLLAGILERHLELKTLTMEERFRNFCRRSSHLLNSIPHKYLASYLNIDATNFSKLFNSVRIG